MKRELNKRKIFFISLLSIFLITFAVQIIAAAMTPQEIVIDPIKAMFTNWTSGQLSINLAKYLFLILMTLLVWSVLDMLGFIQSQAVKWAASLVIAFLSVSYLTPTDVWLLLTNYEALGLTLLFVLPLIILFLFTFRIVVVGGAWGVVIQWGMWLMYFLFLIYEYVNGYTTGRIKTNEPTSWLFIVVLVIVGVMVFLNRSITYMMSKSFIKAEVSTARNVVKKAAKMTKIRAEEMDELSEGRGHIERG